MNVLVDMNLSPGWVAVLRSAGFECLHWSNIGDYGAKDVEIMAWASTNDYVVFTNDLDFGAILASTKAGKPSVIQIRTQDLSPVTLASKLIAALNQFSAQLQSGALLVIDNDRNRVRILPI